MIERRERVIKPYQLFHVPLSAVSCSYRAIDAPVNAGKPAKWNNLNQKTASCQADPPHSLQKLVLETQVTRPCASEKVYLS